jgi:hypothetical protein
MDSTTLRSSATPPGWSRRQELRLDEIVLVDVKELKGTALAEYIEKTYGILHVQREGTTLLVPESAKKPKATS